MIKVGHIKHVMKKPEKILCLDVYPMAHQPIRSSEIGLIYVPLTARLDIDDVFDGRPLFLIDHLMMANDGLPDAAGSIIFVVKKAARRTPEGRVADYFDKCKVTQLVGRTDPRPDAPLQRRQEQIVDVTTWKNVQEPDTFSDDADSSDDPGDWWGESSLSEEEPDVTERPHGRDLSSEFRMISQDDKIDITKKLGGGLI